MFGISIQIRASPRRSQRLHIARLDDCQERRRVLRIAIMQEIAAVSKGAASFHGDIPSHLFHPLLGRMGGDPSDLYPAARKMDEKQHIVRYQSMQREDLHGEEIRPRQHREVSPNEGRPGRRVLALWRRRYPVTTQNVANRLVRNLMPQIGECPNDPVIAQD